jgi:hypothetical protein
MEDGKQLKMNSNAMEQNAEIYWYLKNLKKNRMTWRLLIEKI